MGFGHDLVAFGHQAIDGFLLGSAGVGAQHGQPAQALGLQQRVQTQNRGGRGNAGFSRDGAGQFPVVRKADAHALAAVPHQNVRAGMGQQAGCGQQAFGGIGSGGRVHTAKHGCAGEVSRHGWQVTQDAQRDALDHRIARGRDRANEVLVPFVP